MKISAALTVASLFAVVANGSLVTVDPELTSRTDEMCQHKCSRRNQRMICNDCIPLTVPDTVDEIVLKALHGYRLAAHEFCNVSWANVKMLSILNDFDEPSANIIVDYAFDCLNKVETLKLTIGDLRVLNANTFYGLLNVRVLDLTGCSRLETPALTTALSLNTVIPNLNQLVLSNMGSVYSGIQLSQEFIDVLAQRNITELNLSSSFVETENIPFGRLCETLQIFNFSNTRILYTSTIPRVACESLQVVDLSGTQFSQTIIIPKNLTIKDVKWLWDRAETSEFFSRVRVLLLNNALPVDHHIYIYNSTFIFAVNNSLAELHFGGMNIPIFELEMGFRPNRLTYFDISNNRIERLGPNTFRSLEHLKKLDLSNNKIGMSTTDTFTIVFRNNTKLMSLNLAYNDLVYLPEKVFQFNRRLEQLNLTGNKITQIHFEISELTYLIYIDFRSNLIKYLDASSRQQIDMLYKYKQTYKNIMETNRSFVIDLRDNPFSCRCQSLDFIVWFVNSPVFQDSRDEYHCEIDGQHIPMDTNAITTAEYDCDKRIRKLRQVLLSTLVPCITLSIAGIVSIILFKKYRKFKNLQNLRENIAQINRDTYRYCFPIFLSYASDDSEFVELNILQPLKVSF